MNNVDKYDGSQDSEIWITYYLPTVQVANGNDWHAVKHLPLMLKESTMVWLNPRSVRDWDGL